MHEYADSIAQLLRVMHFGRPSLTRDHSHGSKTMHADTTSVIIVICNYTVRVISNKTASHTKNLVFESCPEHWHCDAIEKSPKSMTFETQSSCRFESQLQLHATIND